MLKNYKLNPGEQYHSTLDTPLSWTVEEVIEAIDRPVRIYDSRGIRWEAHVQLVANFHFTDRQSRVAGGSTLVTFKRAIAPACIEEVKVRQHSQDTDDAVTN